jgi:hypothetical protein
MATQKFNVISCASSAKVTGMFNSKIQTKGSVSTSLGVLGTQTKTKQQTYYFQSNSQFAINSQVDVDIDLYNVEEKPFTLPSTGEVFKLKWLVGMK